ncbi:short-chain dehydrogenase/reductase [Mycobacterium sp. NS-7484]|uniref:SDR family oxidoreductase n=1 Tax=Mycobacterium sp. NS-7484 TaxID=1834161 RepID=UPI00096E4124|nr:SDR family oxidoreductase [Mycobacterium sp. NS-7484]OMC05790.1 short-chain dehydrogenase/reductase [Mycobacterium sp. NS-7484]
MGDPIRTVVITGASRGLGFASTVRLYRDGWRVVAAMRSPDVGMPLLRTATGAGEDDDRLIGVQLDLTDAASISAAAKTIEEALKDTGTAAPHALVHNAGISAAGMVEETSSDLWERMFATNVLGPVALTKALLPAMREAGRGRIVLISSAAGVRGMPATAPYSAVKGALERWGEAMAGEVAPFGIGVTILVTGTYDTDIITDAGTTDDRDLSGPYARHHHTMDTRGRAMMKHAARPPEKFAEGLANALDSTKPFVKTAVGPDARMLLIASRLLPPSALHQMTRVMMGLPRQGTMRGGAYPLTTSQKAMVLAAKALPQPVLTRLAALAARRASRNAQPQQGSSTDA